MNTEFAIPSESTPPVEKKPERQIEEPKWLSVDERRTERLTAIPALYKTSHERLACEIALHMEEPADIFARYGFTAEEAHDLQELPAFQALVKRLEVEVRENGLSFRMKAKAISEDLLQDAYEIATDPLQSGAVRADMIKWAAKVAGNEPAPAKAGVGEPGGGFSLSITFAGQAPQQVLAEGRTIEHQPTEGA